MAIGERIRFIRNLRGMTQKYLGTLVGFPEKTADIRLAQYEAGTRTPKDDLTKAFANALEVSPLALNVPDIDSYLGDKGMDANYITMFEMFTAWKEQAEKLKNGEISKEEYDHWRYNYPKFNVLNSDKETANE